MNDEVYCGYCGREVKLNKNPYTMFEYECEHCGTLDYNDITFEKGE